MGTLEVVMANINLSEPFVTEKNKDRRYLITVANRILNQDKMTLKKLRLNRERGSKFKNYLDNKNIASEVWFKKYLLDAGLVERGRSYGVESRFDWESNYRVGPYYIDFAFPSIRVGIEVDGGIHQDKTVRMKDRIKEAYLESSHKNFGWIIFRVKHDSIYRPRVISCGLAEAKRQILCMHGTPSWNEAKFISWSQSIVKKMIRKEKKLVKEERAADINAVIEKLSKLKMNPCFEVNENGKSNYRISVSRA